MSWGPVTFDPHFGGILNIASGLLLVGLAGFVATVQPRRRANLAFVGFSAAWGLYTVVAWTFGPEPGVLVAPPGSSLYVASRVWLLLLFSAAMTCLVLVAMWFPRSLADEERPFARRAAVGAGLLAIITTGMWVVEAASYHDQYVRQGFAPLAIYAIMAFDLLSVVGRFAVFLFALFLLAFRAGLAHRHGRDVELQQYVLMTVALVLHPGALNGIWASAMDLRSYPGSTLVPVFAALCVLAALWLAHTRSGHAHSARTARNVALLVLALPVVAWAVFKLLKTYVMPGQSVGLAGAMRTLTVVVLAYAILHHQLLGVDVKVRWGISKGTVAAVFIAAFFVASEGAQILFGQGNEWVGLLGAGALVFALAPLQRAAERLAEKAVPAMAAAPGSAVASGELRGEASYRKAVRLAMRDRRISRDEEGQLHELARDLGIDGARAHAIITQVEAERGTESAA